MNNQRTAADLVIYLTDPPVCGGNNQENQWDFQGGRLAHMKCRRNRYYCWLSLALLLFTFVALSAGAATCPISGSYEVIQNTGRGSHTSVLVRFHLTNHGASVLHLRRLVLSDFSHPPTGASVTPPIALSPGTTQDTTQEFSIPRLQLKQWQKGVLPRAVLELETTSGARSMLAIRLEQTPVREGE
jgi:hypothetical protein